MTTTICVNPQTKEMLNELRQYPKEPYNSVIERLARMAIDDNELSDEAIQGIEEALEDIKAGRLHSNDEIKREFGIT
ncbi:conserved hypothetical protein (plasmid) [Methanohalobium evestigatum Z-7303]|uniref:Uncharacterized protein n=1 Tax=Methanohalobium evestigatum (strain ATCC BAA-1072 / DSM 3721 / NBRC 107634 / OCM 161 / Z-7303) TaxID=644295 RepID=D7EC46_METEZ|nr:hypothetical protein [Methanohalobium evestigatum]ADI75168.1 conserved hypothetical protein [Methanohalobium evestigatum Z-7303]